MAPERDAPDDQRADDEYEDDGERLSCLICGGEGGQFGEDLGDPLRWDGDEWVTCSSCGGSGRRKDMTWM